MASRSLKMLFHDGQNHIPQELNYVNPTSDRAKVIRVTYAGQPWHCPKPFDTFHTTRFCPARDDDRKRSSPPEAITTKKTLLLSSSETRPCNAAEPSCNVKVVKWSGGKFGHLENMIEDEETTEFDKIIVLGGINSITGNLEMDKRPFNLHIQILYNALKES
jgi:hypothetical protein